MAMSTCGKCGSHRFEIALVEPAQARFKMYFIQCASCGVPVGVAEYQHIGTALDAISLKLEQVLLKLARLTPT